MATRVEELKDEVLVYSDPWQSGPATKAVDFLIAAAEAQGEAKGRAEGAEEERHKWEAKTLEALLNPDVSIADKLKAADDPLGCVSPFASLLAPATKEAENGNP